MGSFFDNSQFLSLALDELGRGLLFWRANWLEFSLEAVQRRNMPKQELHS